MAPPQYHNSRGGNDCVSLRSGTLSSVHMDDNDNEESDSSEVAAKVMQRISKKFPPKKKKTGVFQVLRGAAGGSNKSSWLDLSHIQGLSTLRGEAVQEMQRHGVQRLDLSKNDCMVVVPVTLVCQQHDRAEVSLACLTALDLSKCQIVILPEDWDLPNLQVLDLSHNRIRDFPSQSILKGLPLLEELNLYGNRLTHVPSFDEDGGGSGSGTFTTTKRDLMTRNPSSSSFSAVATNPPVAAASASVNSRSKQNFIIQQQQQHHHHHHYSLDASLLTHLTYLNIGYNDMAQLPSQLPRKLKTLIACNNMLQEVPHQLILSLPCLKECNVSSNPMREPPLAICQAGLRTMRKYMQQRASCFEAADTEDTNSR